MRLSNFGKTGLRAIALSLALLPLYHSPAAHAQFDPAVFGTDSDEEMLFSADALDYDQESGSVIARGNVEIIYAGRVLRADEVSYNQSEERVIASGNVTLVEPSGEIAFADYAELTRDLNAGFIDNFSALLADDSRLAAASAERTGENLTRLNRAVFSPCDLCEDDPSRPPLWQLKAERIIHDQESSDIIYHHAFMEMYGVPVFYTPYLSHPDPTVTQRSGLLAPEFGESEVLGPYMRGSYYIGATPQRDFTLSTLLSRDQGVQLGGEWRERFEQGHIELEASGTKSQRIQGIGPGATTLSADWRGHIAGEGDVDINENWRGGFELARASDRSYLDEYQYSSPQILDSNIFAEGFYGRNYIRAEVFDMQDLRTGRQAETPTGLPLFEAEFLGDPGGLMGGQWSARFDSATLFRDHSATDSSRFSSELGWQRKYMHPSGLIAQFDLEAALDFFHSNNVAGGMETDFEARFLPQASALISFPMAGEIEAINATHIMTPSLQVIAAPSLNVERDIANEDSQDLQFDALHFFSLNRFTGRDLRESGTRFNYGLDNALQFDNGARASFFIGQSYRIGDDDNQPTHAGLEENLSDIVARLNIAPNENIDLDYRVRLNSDGLEDRRHDLTLRGRQGDFAIAGTYTYGEELTVPGAAPHIQQAAIAGEWDITEEWSLNALHRRDLGPSSGSLTSGLGLTFENECFFVSGAAERNYTQRSGIAAGDTVYFRIGFKHMGIPGRPRFRNDIITYATDE